MPRAKRGCVVFQQLPRPSSRLSCKTSSPVGNLYPSNYYPNNERMRCLLACIFESMTDGPAGGDAFAERRAKRVRACCADSCASSLAGSRSGGSRWQISTGEGTCAELLPARPCGGEKEK